MALYLSTYTQKITKLIATHVYLVYILKKDSRIKCIVRMYQKNITVFLF